MYSIYHIPGVKIGCTDNVKKRVKVQGYNNYKILEEHTDIYEASDREIDLQKQYGYKVDTIPYWQTVTLLNTKEIRAKKSERMKNKPKEFFVKAGKVGGKIGGVIQGKKNVESGHLERIRKKIKKQILAYYKDSKEYIGEFESIAETARELNCSASKVSEVCTGTRPYTKGYTFKYKE